MTEKMLEIALANSLTANGFDPNRPANSYSEEELNEVLDVIISTMDMILSGAYPKTLH